MDTTTLIEIVIVIAVIYVLIKFIVSPIIRAIIGILSILIMISLLQRFFGFDITKTFGPFGKYLDINSWGINLNWLLGPVYNSVDQIKNFLTFIWGNFISKK